MNKAEYERYLNSAWWKERRRARIRQAGYQCEFRPQVGDWHPRHGYALGDRCTEEEPPSILQVHHLCYDRLGQERDDDLEVLCDFHHLFRHVYARCTGDCPTCGDGPMVVDETDVIDAVASAIMKAGSVVDPDNVDCEGHCSYCDSH